MLSLFPCMVSSPLLLILYLDTKPGGVPLNVSSAAQHGIEMELEHYSIQVCKGQWYQNLDKERALEGDFQQLPKSKQGPCK